MMMYLKDLLYMMNAGQILFLHVAGYEPDSFCLAIVDKETTDSFYSYVSNRTHPYLKITKMQACKFIQRGVEAWCE
jgi:hypothetical protein